MKDFELFGNVEQAQNFLDSIKSGQFLLSFVMSYTQTCEIPGITIAGADSDSMKYTPPADAEYLHYGCLLYTSPSPRDAHESRMPSSA